MIRILYSIVSNVPWWSTERWSNGYHSLVIHCQKLTAAIPSLDKTEASIWWGFGAILRGIKIQIKCTKDPLCTNDVADYNRIKITGDYRKNRNWEWF